MDMSEYTTFKYTAQVGTWPRLATALTAIQLPRVMSQGDA
jgi:hypothetical protein